VGLAKLSQCPQWQQFPGAGHIGILNKNWNKILIINKFTWIVEQFVEFQHFGWEFVEHNIFGLLQQFIPVIMELKNAN
jgi:hypothetical protein